MSKLVYVQITVKSDGNYPSCKIYDSAEAIVSNHIMSQSHVEEDEGYKVFILGRGTYTAIIGTTFADEWNKDNNQ